MKMPTLQGILIVFLSFLSINLPAFAEITEADFGKVSAQLGKTYVEICKSNPVYTAQKLECLSPIFKFEEPPGAGAIGGWRIASFRYNRGLNPIFAVEPLNSLPKYLSSDSVALFLCHEMGHRLGGPPYVGVPSFPLKGQASAESSADYFATSRCLRSYFASQDNIEIMSKKSIDAKIRKKCAASFKSNESQIAVCERSIVAALEAAKFLAEIHQSEIPSLDKPDSTVVSKTLEGYASDQCRLDTFIQGALLNPGNGLAAGGRPSCWFNPADPSNVAPLTESIENRKVAWANYAQDVTSDKIENAIRAWEIITTEVLKTFNDSIRYKCNSTP
jgi:hypothetical protein